MIWIIIAWMLIFALFPTKGEREAWRISRRAKKTRREMVKMVAASGAIRKL